MPETLKIDGYTVKIEQDSDPMNPRTEFDNVGKMVCWHTRYNLGDEQPKCDPDEYLLKMMQDRERDLHGKPVPDNIEQKCLEAYINKHFAVLPLYLYDHGSLSISVKPYDCPFDSGRIGFVYVDANSKEYDNLTAGLTTEVQVYNQYLHGDVWGYTIENLAGDVTDSCWGFYGFDCCKSEAAHIISGYPKQLALCV
jgi:hypothetical protein